MSSVQPFETVTGTLLAVDGSPEVGVKLVFDLKEPGQHAGSASSITTARRSVVTDENGAFSVQLFRTEDDLGANYYTLSRVVAGGLGIERLVDPQNFSVPAGGPFDFAALVQQFSVQRMGLDAKIAAAAVNTRLNADRAQGYRDEIDPDGLEVRFTDSVNAKVDQVTADMQAAVDGHVSRFAQTAPFVNLLKNSHARDEIGGVLQSPISFYSPSDQRQMTLVEPVSVWRNDDARVPAAIAAIAQARAGTANDDANVIRMVVTSPNPTGEMYFFAHMTVPGRVSSGFDALMVVGDGASCRITDDQGVRDVPLVSGEVVRDVRHCAYRQYNIDGSAIKGQFEALEIFIVRPWVCAGQLYTGLPAFVLTNKLHLED